MDPLVLGLLVATITILILFSGISVANGLLVVSAIFLLTFDGFRSLELIPEVLGSLIILLFYRSRCSS